MLDLAFRLKRIDRINYVSQLNAAPEVLEAVATSTTFSATTIAGTGAVLMESAAAAATQSASLISGEDADTTAWVNAVIAAGGAVSPTRRALMDTYIVGLKTDTVWAELDRLWIHAGEDFQSGMIDLVTRATATLYFANNFHPNSDIEPLNSAGYVLLNYNLLTDSVNLNANSAHIMAWILDSNSVTAASCITDNPGTNCAIWPKYTDGNIYARVFDISGGFVMSDPTGMLLANRSSSVARQLYQNGVALGDTAAYGTQGTQGVPNRELVLFDRKTAASSVGGSLDATQELAYYNRTFTLLTAIGAI